MVARKTSNLEAVGSSPTWSAMYIPLLFLFNLFIHFAILYLFCLLQGDQKVLFCCGWDFRALKLGFNQEIMQWTGLL
jgi:hypothetical protein